MNAMMWVRGFAADYDEWGAPRATVGLREHREVLRPHRERAAGDLSSAQPAQLDRGLAQRRAAVRLPDRTTESGCAGRLLRDHVTQRRGARWSTADAYLKPALQAAEPHTAHGGHRDAGAVRWDARSGWNSSTAARRVVRARREVVLCGGAINSPQLLMLSGIGDRDQLAEHGIEWSACAAGREQPDRPSRRAAGLRRQERHPVRRREAVAAGQLSGPAARHAHLQRGGSVWVREEPPGPRLPDLELIFVPAPYFDEGIGDPYEGHAVVMGPILLKPHSRGTITLRSSIRRTSRSSTRNTSPTTPERTARR